MAIVILLNKVIKSGISYQNVANILGLVDQFDVPISEKMIVQNIVENNCTNSSNVIFINKKTNIYSRNRIFEMFF